MNHSDVKKKKKNNKKQDLTWLLIFVNLFLSSVKADSYRRQSFANIFIYVMMNY